MDISISVVVLDGHERVRVLAKCADLYVSGVYPRGYTIAELLTQYSDILHLIENGAKNDFIDSVVCISFDDPCPRISVRGEDRLMNDYGQKGICRCLRAILNGCSDYLRYNSDIRLSNDIVMSEPTLKRSRECTTPDDLWPTGESCDQPHDQSRDRIARNNTNEPEHNRIKSLKVLKVDGVIKVDKLIDDMHILYAHSPSTTWKSALEMYVELYMCYCVNGASSIDDSVTAWVSDNNKWISFIRGLNDKRVTLNGEIAKEIVVKLIREVADAATRK